MYQILLNCIAILASSNTDIPPTEKKSIIFVRIYFNASENKKINHTDNNELSQTIDSREKEVDTSESILRQLEVTKEEHDKKVAAEIAYSIFLKRAIENEKQKITNLKNDDTKLDKNTQLTVNAIQKNQMSIMKHPRTAEGREYNTDRLERIEKHLFDSFSPEN